MARDEDFDKIPSFSF